MAGNVTRNCQSAALISANDQLARAGDKTASNEHASGSTKLEHSRHLVPTPYGHQSKPGEGMRSIPGATTDNMIRQPSEGVTGMKRPRDNDEGGDFYMLDKRQKLDQNADPQCSPSLDASNNVTISLTSSKPITDSTYKASKPKLPAVVHHLRDKYEFSTMSVLSSSKIESRVRNLLAKTAHSALGHPDIKPAVVILEAKAKVAGKMCSIVEIAKEQIRREKGTFWQYSVIYPKLLEENSKTIKRTAKSTLAGRDNEQGGSEGTRVEGTDQPDDLSLEGQDHGDEDENGDEAFETMNSPRERSHAASFDRSTNKRIRTTPVMTIFFARVPVPGLKQIYGEQTNA